MSTSSVSLPVPAEKSAATGKRVWLFRVLVVAAAALFLGSWFLPWWHADVIIIKAWAQIRPWGLELDPYTKEYFPSATMPVWFAPFMWAYLVAAMAVLLFGMFAKDRVFSFGKFKSSLPRLLIGLVGLTYIIAVVVFIFYASMRVSEFYNLHLVGKQLAEIDADMHIVSAVDANLQLGYWLACVVGPLLLVLALVRDRIIGKPKLAT